MELKVNARREIGRGGGGDGEGEIVHYMKTLVFFFIVFIIYNTEVFITKPDLFFQFSGRLYPTTLK